MRTTTLSTPTTQMMTSTSTTSMASLPKTGREFALSRELLGISVYAVASRLGVDSTTLWRWEADCNPVDAMRGQRWRTVFWQPWPRYAPRS